MPVVVEGDWGMYKQESHPVGLLMRRADGTTRHEGLRVHRDPRQQTGIQEINSAIG